MFSFIKRLCTFSRISMVPPKPCANRFGIAITAIVKNESRYIGEWAEFHLKAGVRHFYVYDNGSTDNTAEILKAVLPADALSIIPWSQTIGDARYQSVFHNQVLAYAHSASNFGANYRWMAFIDVDEFLTPITDSDLNMALAHLDAEINLSLPWHMFGTNGHSTDPGGSVVKNYTARHADPMTSHAGLRNFKCIVDPCALTKVRVHSMQTGSGATTSNDRGDKVSIKDRSQRDFYSTDRIQLNHYYTRSKQEFLDKMKKGHIISSRSSRYAEKLPAILEAIDQDVVQDTKARDVFERLSAR